MKFDIDDCDVIFMFKVWKNIGTHKIHTRPIQKNGVACRNTSQVIKLKIRPWQHLLVIQS